MADESDLHVVDQKLLVEQRGSVAGVRLGQARRESRDHGIELLHLCDASAFGGTLRLANLPHDLCFQSIDAMGCSA